MGTIVGWKSAGVKAISLILLAGCGSRQQVSMFPPVDAAQRTSALEAVSGLREVFNRNAGCEAVYNFPSYPKERWLADCAQLQSDMGSWQSFGPRTIARCAMPETIICLDGDANFAKGDRIMELTWLLKDGRAKLLAIAWHDGRQWIRIPPFTDRHQDTPPVPGNGPTNKSG
jgi:hypothetical protein